MALRSKQAGPVDRAVADLDRQIHALERQIRQRDVGHMDRPVVPSKSVTQFVKEMLAPPSNRPAPAARKPRRDLFDVEAEPLKELEAEAIAFAAKPEPDLFKPAAPVREHDRKLVQYLSAGGIRTYKPLKHVQRQVRNRFFMWLGLSAVALWVLYAVVR